MITESKGFHYLMWVALVAVVIITVPNIVLAATLDSELGGGLCKIVNALTGKTGRAIASIGICILGIGAFFGKVNWGLAMTVAVGVMAIFGSMSIAGALGGFDPGGAMGGDGMGPPTPSVCP